MYSSVQGSDVLKRPKDQSTVMTNILANIHRLFSDTERQAQCWFLVRSSEQWKQRFGQSVGTGHRQWEHPTETQNVNMDLDTDKTWKKIMFGNTTHFQM